MPLLKAGVTAWRRGPLALGGGKLSWFQKILIDARTVSALWVMFCARGRKDEDMSPRFSFSTGDYAG